MVVGSDMDGRCVAMSPVHDCVPRAELLVQRGNETTPMMHALCEALHRNKHRICSMITKKTSVEASGEKE